MTQRADQGSKVLVCVHRRLTEAKPSCGARGGLRIAELLRGELARRGLVIPVEHFVCFGHCDHGPNVRLAPAGAFFSGVTEERIGELGLAIGEFLEPNAGDR